MVREFERDNIIPQEVDYTRGRDLIMQITMDSRARGQVQPNMPFIIILYGTPNSGKSHLAKDLRESFIAQGLKTENHTNHEQFGVDIPLTRIQSLDVLIIEEVALPVGRDMHGQLGIGVIDSLHTRPDLRVQIFNPYRGVPPVDRIVPPHLRISNPLASRKII